MARAVWEIGDKTIIAANSWLKQMCRLLYVHMAHTDISITQTDGTDISVSANGYDFRCTADLNDTNYGIIIGSSNQPVDVSNDYALVSPYSTTDFVYSSCTVQIGGSYAEVFRSFRNVSGTSKDIYEVGLYCMTNDSSTFCCIERTVLGTPITVAPDEEVPIRFKMNFV